MNHSGSWLEAFAQKAHDTLKWLLSALSAAATIGFVVFLETA
jgi:hypothetical protein